MTKFEKHMDLAMWHLALAGHWSTRAEWETDVPEDKQEAFEAVRQSIQTAFNLADKHFGHIEKEGEK